MSALLRSALIGKQEPRHQLAVLQMLHQDFFDVGHRLGAIPCTFGINHQHRAFAAAIKASGIIDADIIKTQLFRTALQMIAERFGILVGAATARMTGRPLIAAAEDMGAKILVCFLHSFVRESFGMGSALIAAGCAAEAAQALLHLPPEELLHLFKVLQPGREPGARNRFGIHGADIGAQLLL